VLLRQVRPVAHELFGWQQGWPRPPHAMQKLGVLPRSQTVSGDVQGVSVRPEQHCWPIAPQRPPQLPFVQAPRLFGHCEPDPVQTVSRPASVQQPPLRQLRPAQQGWPGPPHDAHRVPSQTVFGAVHPTPMQQN
jgi:hypothetical protein